MKGEDKNTGVDDFMRAQKDKSRDLSAQQQTDRAEPGDLPPGTATNAQNQAERD